MSMTSPGSPGMIVRDLDGELLVLDTASNHIHQLNHTATIVWRMCRQGAAPAAIAAALAADFAVDETQALADVQQTLQQLASLNLLCAHA